VEAGDVPRVSGKSANLYSNINLIIIFIPLCRPSLFLQVILQKGVDDVNDDDNKREPVRPITSACDSVLGY
jgi:hypothetical protein